MLYSYTCTCQWPFYIISQISSLTIAPRATCDHYRSPITHADARGALLIAHHDALLTTDHAMFVDVATSVNTSTIDYAHACREGT